jgi:hypothetical protein
MNTRMLVRILSVAVLGLSALAIYQGRLLQLTASASRETPGMASPARPPAPVEAMPSRPGDPAPPPTPEPAPAAAPSRATAFHWRRVETPDYLEYVANLRAIGCPEQTIRDIVIADVNKLYAVRRAELITGGTVPPFWQTVESLPAPAASDLQQSLLAMDRDRATLVRELLGVDLATEQRKSRDGVSYPENRLGFLAPEKQDQVSAVREAMNEQWAALQNPAAQEGQTPESIAAALRRINEERLAKLAAILTPEELREHELQTSWTGITLRNRLTAFQPSQTEFAALYDLQKPFDDEYVHYAANRSDPALLQRREQARQELDARIRLVLGEQRYAEYVAAQQPGGSP